mmetsp:Transcript_51351/g.123583  ORF Transcript_51351/g.123583 Transcript_51351/m.123583 type:complete len:350 (+) Transcript_51351:921-1970(+)
MPHAVVAGADERHEAGAQAKLRRAAFCLPILPDDQELALAGVEVTRRADGVDALLDGRHQLHILLERDVQRLELCHVIRKAQRLQLPVLELRHLPVQSELRDLNLLLNVLGIGEQLLQELAGGLAEDVQVLCEQLLHRREHNHAILVLRCQLLNRDHGQRVDTHRLHELSNLLGIVSCIHGKCLAIGTVAEVLNAGALYVALHVEAGAVVVFRCQEPPVGDLQQHAFSDVWPSEELRAVLRLERQVLGKVTNIVEFCLRRRCLHGYADILDVFLDGNSLRRLDVNGSSVRMDRGRGSHRPARLRGRRLLGICLGLEVADREGQRRGGADGDGGLPPPGREADAGGIHGC